MGWLEDNVDAKVVEWAAADGVTPDEWKAHAVLTVARARYESELAIIRTVGLPDDTVLTEQGDGGS